MMIRCAKSTRPRTPLPPGERQGEGPCAAESNPPPTPPWQGGGHGIAAGLLAVLLLVGCRAAPERYDIVIYGGTAGGVSAAVKAARLGHTVVLIEPGRHLGGMSAGGLGATDIGNKAAIGGLAREFYRRVGAAYGQDEAWLFEPHVAEGVFNDLVREAGVPVLFGERLQRPTGVNKRGPRIDELVLESGRRIRGRIFIDATYEGDLLAAAGVSYTIGRESNATYDETLNGVRVAQAKHHQFIRPVDPYIVPGDPRSGLLPGIDPAGPGAEGAGDRRVQAYNFRICATDVPANRRPWPLPADYDPLQYELLLRNFEAGDEQIPWHAVMMPNRKTDANNNHAVSTDYIGMNYDYADGDYTTRAQIIAAHRSYQQGLFWTLANSPRVPADVRAYFQTWGLAKDEFVDDDNWPHQLYVREARRMVGDYVMTQHDCQGRRTAEEPVGLAAYTMDSHNVQRYVDADGHVRNEGDVQVGGFPPYPIAYRAIVPRAAECTNLLVPVCLSASHIAYGSIRMEPVFMVLGESAAAAASLAIELDADVQAVPYERLAPNLEAVGQVLAWPAPPPPPATAWIRANQIGYLPGDPKIAILSSERPLAGQFRVGPFIADIGPDCGAWGPFAHNYRLDFSALAEPGRYVIRFQHVASRPFVIGANAYQDVPGKLLEFMHLQRCGDNPITGLKCHQQDAIDTETGARLDLRGGWHDAGDRLKHMITTSYCVAALLLAGAREEGEYGADLLVRLHPDPDTIYVQIGDDRDHAPPETLWHDDQSDYGWGPGGARSAWPALGRPQGPKYQNASTGVASLAARTAAALVLAGKLDTAKSLYALARAKPGCAMSVPVRAPYYYGEATYFDDLEWAATELYIATRDRQYLAQALQYADEAAREPHWMGTLRHGHYEFFPYINLAHWRLYPHVDRDAQARLAGYYRTGLERVRTLAEQNPYRLGTPLVWCSTNDVVAFATQAVLYEQMTGDTQFRALAAEARDWIFGRNPWGVSFVLGVPADGDAASRPHHLFWKLKQHLPVGGLVDGPVYKDINDGLKFSDWGPDRLARFQSDVGVYHDVFEDFSTNEPIIDGTVSLLLLLRAWDGG